MGAAARRQALYGRFGRRLRFWQGWGPVGSAGALLGLAALLGTGAWLLWPQFGSDPSCGAGVEKRGPEQECTGVTDGSVAFAPSLRAVSGRIKAENDRIAHKPHATIAMMVPMTSADPVVKGQIRSEVQGAYLAQYRANHESNAKTPAIRLVLANPGGSSAHWRPVADQLVEMAGSKEHHLRAVTGFDLSVARTKKTIAYLTNGHGIPVVGGPITADDLANTPDHPNRFKGLARVVPTNSDQAAALSHFNKDVKPERTLVVEDRREDDNYVTTLKAAFEARTKGAPLAPEQYESPADFTKEGNLSNVFDQMVNNICDSTADVIYFAGRPVQLRQFVNELGGRGCAAEKNYTVVTGSGASTLGSDKKLDWAALKRGVEVQYASVGHPRAWTSKDAPATGGSKEAFMTLKDLADRAERGGKGAARDSGKNAARNAAGPIGPIGPVGLDDSRTISAYDSAWTAITSVRKQTSGDTPMPSLAEVAGGWLRLRGENKVEGASGWICLDNYGSPFNKAVSVVRLDPRGRRIDFAGLAWPENKPPGKNCTVPNNPGRK